MTSFEDRFVLVGERRIHYLDGGDGPLLVLLHSGGASCRQYEPVLAALAANHRVIAWDMFGHGDSDQMTSHHAMEDHRDIFAGFADALGLDRFILSGSSMGGYISMAYAAAFPERVERLIIVEAPLRSREWYDANWLSFEAMCAIPETSFDNLAGRIRGLTPDMHRRWNIDRSKAGGWTMVDMAWACREFDAAGTYAAITVPTRVLVGSKGPTALDIDRMRSLRPAAAITIMEDCGHFPMLEDPDGFANVLTDVREPALA